MTLNLRTVMRLRHFRCQYRQRENQPDILIVLETSFD